MSTLLKRIPSKQHSFSKDQRSEIKSLKTFIQHLVLSIKTREQMPNPPHLKHFSILSESLEELASVYKEEKHRKRPKTTSDFKVYQAEFESIQREVDQLRNEVLISCSTLHYVLEEGERLGIRKSKHCTGLRGYVEAVKDLVSSMCKEFNDLKTRNENTLESSTRRSVESYETFKFRNDNESVILTLLVSVLGTAKDLQAKVFSYASCLKKIRETIDHDRENLKSLIQVQNTHRKPPSKLRVVFKAVLAAVRLSHLPKTKFCMIRGLKVKLTECQRFPGHLTMQSLLSFLEKFSFKKSDFHLFNASLIENLKALKRLSNESESIISLLMNEHKTQKEEILQLIRQKEELKVDKEQSLSQLRESQGWVQRLEEQIRRFEEEQVDPEEFEEVLVELESHKRALKGLTSKYNELEQTKDALQKEYQEICTLSKFNNPGSV